MDSRKARLEKQSDQFELSPSRLQINFSGLVGALKLMVELFSIDSISKLSDIDETKPWIHNLSSPFDSSWSGWVGYAPN